MGGGGSVAGRSGEKLVGHGGWVEWRRFRMSVMEERLERLEDGWRSE